MSSIGTQGNTPGFFSRMLGYGEAGLSRGEELKQDQSQRSGTQEFAISQTTTMRIDDGEGNCWGKSAWEGATVELEWQGTDASQQATAGFGGPQNGSHRLVANQPGDPRGPARKVELFFNGTQTVVTQQPTKADESAQTIKSNTFFPATLVTRLNGQEIGRHSVNVKTGEDHERGAGRTQNFTLTARKTEKGVETALKEQVGTTWSDLRSDTCSAITSAGSKSVRFAGAVISTVFVAPGRALMQPRTTLNDLVNSGRQNSASLFKTLGERLDPQQKVADQPEANAESETGGDVRKPDAANLRQRQSSADSTKSE